MKRRRALVAVALAVGATAAAIALRAGATPAARPCVLIVSIDTCRADAMGFLGCRLAGGASPTPHLDALAGRAAVAGFGLSPVPLTLPAHATLLTGLYPDATGVRENDSFRVLPREERGYSLLAEDLRDAGYDTAAFVSGQPLERRFGLDQGFRVYDQPDKDRVPGDAPRFRERSARETTERALAYLEGAARAPWFLFVHYFDPHDPYEPPAPPEPLAADDPRRAREGYETYLAEIAAVDRELGRLLGALPGGGDGVLVVVVGDHGEALGEHGERSHGYLVHEATLRVPFIVKPPGAARLAARDVPPRLVDVAPTVRELLGLDPGGRPVHGEPLTRPADASWSHRSESLYPWFQLRYARVRSFRDRKLKLVEGGGRRTLFAWGEDPGERHDLAGTAPGEVARLEAALFRDLGRIPSGRAGELHLPAQAAHPYIGGRVPGPIEPGEEENRELPRVEDRWDVIDALERARHLIAARRPGEARLLLDGFAEGREENPSLLFWSARARQLAGRDRALDPGTRTALLTGALDLFERHAARYKDPRSLDSQLRVLLDLHAVDGAAATLADLERRAAARERDGTATALTFALRARAREQRGDREGAAADFEQARRLDPDDPNFAEDLRRLRGR